MSQKAGKVTKLLQVGEVYHIPKPHTWAEANPKPLDEKWLAFIALCVKLSHGEFVNLKIQDGVPVCAEIVKEKVKF